MIQVIKNIIDSFPSKIIHGKFITFESRIFEIPEQGIELKVFANNVFIIYYNIVNNKFEMDIVCRYNSSQTEVDNSIIEYVENLLKQYGIVL